MIFVTGDCHGEFLKLSGSSFPEQNEMTKDDIVIICGDFGAVWDCDGASIMEKYWLNWLNEKPFTTVFVDGNHENFDRLNSEFEVVDFHGGKAHRIKESVYHLMRREIFEFEGKKFLLLAAQARTILTTVFFPGKILKRRKNSGTQYIIGASSARCSVSTEFHGGKKNSLQMKKYRTLSEN